MRISHTKKLHGTVKQNGRLRTYSCSLQQAAWTEAYMADQLMCWKVAKDLPAVLTLNWLVFLKKIFYSILVRNFSIFSKMRLTVEPRYMGRITVCLEWCTSSNSCGIQRKSSRTTQAPTYTNTKDQALDIQAYRAHESWLFVKRQNHTSLVTIEW